MRPFLKDADSEAFEWTIEKTRQCGAVDLEVDRSLAHVPTIYSCGLAGRLLIFSRFLRRHYNPVLRSNTTSVRNRVLGTILPMLWKRKR